MDEPRAHLIRLDLRQLDCLSSAVRVQLFAAFKLLGPCPIARVATMLGRPANSLYHHVNKMRDSGLLRLVRTERVGKRDQAVLDIAADFVLPEPPPWTIEYEEGLAAFRGSVFESTRRFAEHAIRRPDGKERVRTGNRVGHHALWLAPETAVEVVRRLKEVENWAIANQEVEGGLPFALLTAIVPSDLSAP